MLQHYEDQSCPDAAGLLAEDAITYSVLMQILQSPCADIYTDHETLILCYSNAPYPVWVWCRNPENRDMLADAARCLKTAFPLEQGFSWNLSVRLLEKLQTYDPYFREAKPEMGLLSQRLDTILPIDRPCGGTMRLAQEADIPFLTAIWKDMAYEMEGFHFSEAQCRDKAQRLVESNKLFLWCNEAQQIVALTSRGDAPPYSKVATVYTLPEHRRKGYALNLVRRVSLYILGDGLIPILYTDAGYRPSNDCYRKIGYRVVGELVKVSIR